MVVRSLSKVSLACLAVCVGTSGAVAQKNPGKIIKAVVKTPTLNVIENIQPPLRVSGALPSFETVLRQNVVHSLQLATQREEAKRTLAPATAARQRALAAQKMPRPRVGQEFTNEEMAYIAKQTAPVRHYLDMHDNTWPTYLADGSNNRVLRHIRNFMEVEQPSAAVLAIQQELIRMRANSQARTPQEIKTLVHDMLEYGIVPQRVSFGFPTDQTEDELALGEDLAFAMAASKVPMENNPWQMEGTKILADKVATYNAMRRVSPLKEGLPVTYKKDGMHLPNFPVWTQAEYATNQLFFAAEHPFEYALAPYREKYFGTKLPSIYNMLSDVEKKAIMFQTPDIQTDTDTKISIDWYEEDTLKWDREHPDRGLRSFLFKEDAARFKELLARSITTQYQIIFYGPAGEQLPFSSLPYEQQVEFLRWAWQTHRLLPQTVLNVLYK